MAKNIIIDVVIPVHNEENILEQSVVYLRHFFHTALPKNMKCRIVIADNGSTDSTNIIGRKLENLFKDVSCVHINVKGRGIALRKTWMASNADYVVYMDVDLATNLKAFPKLIKALQDGYQIAVGSRLALGAKVKRSFHRSVLSYGYNALIKEAFKIKFSDAQCGFKAMQADAAKKIIPMIKNNNWFFDTELLILAEKLNWNIFETSVSWNEGWGTQVNVPKTICEYLKEIYRMKKRLRAMKLSGILL